MKINNLKSSKKFIQFIIIIGLFVCILGSVEGKDATIDSLKQVLLTEKSDSAKYLLCRQIGDAYYEGNFDSLLLYYRKSLVLAQQTKNTREEISTLRSFAYIYKYRKDDYRQAAYYFQKAYTVTEEKKDTLAQAYILNDLGELYRTQGENIKAVEYLFRANKNAELLQHKHLLTRTWHSIGLLHSEKEEHQEALSFYKKTLPFTEEKKYARMRGVLFNSIGKTQRDLKQYEEAATSFQTAFLLFEELGDNDLKVDVLYNMAKNEFVTAAYPPAIQHYKAALQLNEIIDNQERAAMILAALAEAYAANKAYTQAITTANKGLNIVNSIDTRLHAAELHTVLAKSYAHINNHQLAYHHQQHALMAKDSLQLEAASKKLATMTLRYQQEKKNVEIQQLKAASAEQNLALGRTKFNNRLIILISLLLLSLVFLGQYYRKTQLLHQYKQLRIQLTNDLHDNVSSSLNHIKIMANRLYHDRYPQAQKKESIQQIKNISNEVVDNMHDLIWGLDDSKETIADLVARMRDHASNILPASGLPYQLKNQIKKGDKLVKAIIKNNIYAIYKEAINNVLKHAQPEKILITFSLEKNLFTMKIVNDTYVLKEAIQSSKIGIKSMQQRAEAIGGTVKIQNEKDTFSLTLTVPV